MKRTVYDFDEAAARIRNSGFPKADQHASQLFVELLSREETTQFFQRLAKESEEAAQGP